MSAPATVAKEKPSRRVTLSPRASFWAAAAFAFLAFAANTAASPLYRVYENQFRFSPTTLTLLFTVYIVVLLATLLLFGSVSDYSGSSDGDAGGSGFRCGRVRLVPHRPRGWAAVCGPGAAGCRGWPYLRSGQRGTARFATTRRRRTGRLQRSAHGRPGPRRNRRQRARPVRSGADPPGLVAVTRGFHHRRGHRTGDARAWNDAPRRCELAAAACQRAAGGQGRLRHGGAGPRGNLGTRRLLSVAGTVACRAAAALEELALGRHLDIPAHRSRGRSLGLARQEESVRGDAGRLPAF